MRLTLRSTTRFNTFNAFSLSGGQPQMPSPVRRIAPKPSRFTGRSPPIFQTELAAAFGDEDGAPEIIRVPPVKIAAPAPTVNPTNARRLKSPVRVIFEF